MNLSSSQSYPLDDFDYRLLDSGEFQKLERFGSHLFIRPAPQAIWPKTLAENEWRRAEGEYKYFKGKESGGEWKFFNKLPKDGWPLKFRELTFKIKPTGFGHIGIFPEQALNWIWIDEQIRSNDRTDINILNIFGYTGASTLASALPKVLPPKMSRPKVSRPKVSRPRTPTASPGRIGSPMRPRSIGRAARALLCST